MDRKLWMEARGIAARLGHRDQEDLAQELVVAALEGGGRVGKVGAWLERVGRNAVIDGWRVEKRRAELAPAIEPPTGSPDPEAVLLGRERRELVRRALVELPRGQRRAAIARFHGELAFEEVAARIGTETVTARTRVHRALAAMRNRLGGLRGMLVIPGTQAAVLGLALLAAQLPATPRPIALAGGEAASSSVGRHRPPARVMAAAPAVKATPKAAPVDEPRVDARDVPAVQKFNFDDEAVLGELLGPDWTPITGTTEARHSSLIELRQHFVPEMVKTLEDL